MKTKSLKDIKEMIEKGEKVYYIKFNTSSHRSPLSCGWTYFYFITSESKPNLDLSIRENENLQLIKYVEEDKICVYHLKTRQEEYAGYFIRDTEMIAFSDEPFRLLLGAIGTGLDRHGCLKDAKEIKSIEEFYELLKL